VRELDHAVAAEQYERAAKLRDRLNSMDVKTRPSGAGEVKKVREDQSKA
jgi:protein-arginine kinase activator protein McsA